MGDKGSLRLPTPMVENSLQTSSGKKLLDRVAFWIVYIAWRVAYKIAAYNATSVGVGRKKYIFCVCVTETIIVNFIVSIETIIVNY